MVLQRITQGHRLVWCTGVWLMYADCCVMVLHVGVVVLQDIQQRAANKEHMLGLVNAERKATNDRKRIERELFDSLRRDKVDSIQKMQVGSHSHIIHVQQTIVVQLPVFLPKQAEASKDLGLMQVSVPAHTKTSA